MASRSPSSASEEPESVRRALVDHDEAFPPDSLVEVCRHCGNDAETVRVCGRCRGRGWVTKSEHGGDSSKGMGWANYTMVTCPECGGKRV